MSTASTMDLTALTPFLVLAGGGLFLVLLDAIVGRRRTIPWSVPTLAILAAAVWSILTTWMAGSPDGGGAGAGRSGLEWLVSGDRLAGFLSILVCASAALTVLMSGAYLRRRGRLRGEFYSLVVFSASGMVLFSAATDLLMLFLGLELLSIPVYILSGYFRGDLKSAEAAMKYFLLGAFSSAIFLLGIAFVFGATGTTSLRGAIQVGSAWPFLLQAGYVLVLTGFLFKVASVPFHMWTPDVYEGAPTTVTAFMATAVKAAAFGALLRALSIRSGVLTDLPVPQVLWWLAVLTMTVGNLAALTQSNVKRMLAYSSIAHAGYILVGATVFAATGDREAVLSILYYLLAYTFMTIGSFAVVVALGEKGNEHTEMGDYGGLGWRYPALGIAMSLFMISLAGIPPTAGFFGKYAIFKNAVEHGYVPLVVIAVLNSALSVYYYLKVMVTLYMRPEAGSVQAARGWTAGIVIGLCGVAVLWAGFGPDGVLPGVSTILTWARDSTLAFR